MLVGYKLDGSAQHFEIVDIGGIGAYRSGQSALLRSFGLVRRIEKWTHFGIVGEHALVEMPGQRFAMLLQNGGRGFDDIYGVLVQQCLVLKKCILNACLLLGAPEQLCKPVSVK